MGDFLFDLFQMSQEEDVLVLSLEDRQRALQDSGDRLIG
jgi:hypothetical protein